MGLSLGHSVGNLQGVMEGVDRLWGKEVLVVVGCCI